ncbi:PP2C family protein-serine/threonine phosphatase [Streptomyces niger]|uniref:PP2C family protein-serine/threonine phosphatase n=1 Tax=Streptomyces niger TaxID=66373 RepID=UPI000B2679AB|nr:PP2C family protein-serine/threonine phosphatase [Streptomyces niger]
MPFTRLQDSGRRRALLLSAVVALIATADALTGPQVRLISFAGIAPMFAALRCSARWTAVVTASYVAAGVVLYARNFSDWTMSGSLVGLAGTLVVAVFAQLLCHNRRRRDDAFDRTRLVADEVQRAMLHELPLRAGGYAVAGFYVSALEGARVGGDIYEAVETPYGTRLVIGDVQGKGMPAIGAGHEALASFREAAHYEATLEGVAARMEASLRRHNARAVAQGGTERFVTALLIEIGPDGHGRSLSCGHIPYYVVRGGRVVERDEGQWLPLGLGELTGERRRAHDAWPLDEDWAVLCTDGVTEARRGDGTFYPLGERLARWTGMAPAELATALRADLTEFTGGRLKDDATVLIVRRSPDSAPLRPTAEQPPHSHAPNRSQQAPPAPTGSHSADHPQRTPADRRAPTAEPRASEGPGASAALGASADGDRPRTVS